jgi:hypothetical protein
MILTPICVRFSPFRCRSPRFFRRAPPSSWKKLSGAQTPATPPPPHSGPWARASCPTTGAPAPPLLAIAHRLLPSGAIAPAVAAPTTSPTPSTAEAVAVAAAVDVGAVATTPGSSTLGRGPPLAPSSSRTHGSHLHRHRGSLAHRQHGRRRHPASSARAPA